jgi:putative transposase
MWSATISATWRGGRCWSTADPGGQTDAGRRDGGAKGATSQRSPPLRARSAPAFTSRILPPYMRHSAKVAEVLPILCLRGPSTGDFRPALEGLLGEDVDGLSPTNVTRLTACWAREYTAFRQRDLAGREYVTSGSTACTSISGSKTTGAAPRSRTACGPTARRSCSRSRTSAASWKTLLRDFKRRGRTAPVVAVGDGALGFLVLPLLVCHS